MRFVNCCKAFYRSIFSTQRILAAAFLWNYSHCIHLLDCRRSKLFILAYHRLYISITADKTIATTLSNKGIEETLRQQIGKMCLLISLLMWLLSNNFVVLFLKIKLTYLSAYPALKKC